MANKLNWCIEWSSHPSNLIFDCRPVEAFSNRFIEGSIFGGYNHFYFQHLSKVFPVESNIVVIVENEEYEAEIRGHLVSSGFKSIECVIAVEQQEWYAGHLPFDMVVSIASDELALDISFDDNLRLVDVREDSEFEEVHFADTHPMPLSEMGDVANLAILPNDVNLYLFCNDGERSLTAATILKRHGIHNLRVVEATWEELTHITALVIREEKKANLN